MKIFFPIVFVISLLNSCISNQKVDSENTIDSAANIQNSEIEKFIAETTILNNNRYLHGTWITEGNDGVLPNWIEFDTTTTNFISWLDGKPKPEEFTGKFSVNPNKLELNYSEFNDIQAFQIDSISEAYLSLSPMGVNAGNLIYLKKEYQPISGRVIFFHLNEQEFDSLASLPDYQGLYEVSSDFGFYVNKVINALKGSSIKAEVTTDRIISVNGQEIDKMDYNGYGVVLVSSDSIKVVRGIMTDVDYFQLISDFF